MKHTRKIASLLLALVMVFALATTAFAEGETGSITINDAVVGQTYNIYQILDLESYNASVNAYSYKATTAWNTFINSDAIKGIYVEVDAQGYVTWKEGADAAAFAKAAQKYAKDNSIANQDSVTATTTTVSFAGLDLGYYLVDSTLGTLCSLDTTNPNVVMEEKNEVPTPDKTVKEDSTGEYGDSNTAQIGDTVEFKTTIHAKKGAQNYKLHDQMEAGLTLNKDSIVVKVGETALTVGTHYTVAFDVTCKDAQGNVATCDFEVSFAQSYLDTITADTDIVVTYTAVLNENAEIANATNDNDTVLDYGDKSRSEWDKTTTKTFSFDIVKTDSNMKLLNGAKFELYDAQTAGNKIALVKVSNGVYRIATAAEKNAESFSSAVIEAGRATVMGMDANTTYWLEETEAPAGYNRLAGRVAVAIKNANLSTTMEGDTWVQGNGGVQITNKAGTELPSTGGIGTTIFYVMGSILVLGAAVLLVTKKRMAMNG